MTSINDKPLSVDTATNVTHAKNSKTSDIRYQFNFERFLEHLVDVSLSFTASDSIA